MVKNLQLNLVWRYLILGAILLLMIFPLFWMFRVSFLPLGSETSMGNLFSPVISLAAYSSLLSSDMMIRAIINSLLVGTLVVAGNILFCFMTAYTLARHRFLVNKALFGSAIIILMIPAHISIIPLYVLLVKAHMYDTIWALVLPWLVTPIGIFLLKQYIESIPTSMEEAARIDGASEFRILFSVVMPMCRPALAVLAIQTFFTNWNSFLFPFILTSSDNLRTLPVALALLQGHQAIDWQRLMAGSAIAVVPVLIVFLILQRQIISGITAGAIKQ